MVTVNDILSNQYFLDWYFETSPESVSKWEQLLQENPNWNPLAAEVTEWLQSLQLKEKPITNAQVEAAFNRLQNNIQAQSTAAPVLLLKPGIKRWLMASAAAVLFAIAGVWFFKNMNSKNTIGTQYGEIKAKVLPDGSEVTLNAHSNISFGEKWKEGQEREVWIKGEAYFHVKKTPEKSRFIVHTDRFDIIVTGTQFNVINRDGKTSVLLNEGSVTIKDKAGNEIKMKPGDYVEMQNDAIQKSTLQNINIVTAWKEKKMLFDNTTIEDAARMIEETYGVKVKIDADAAAKRITGIMPNDNLDVLLQALEASDFNIERKENSITIK